MSGTRLTGETTNGAAVVDGTPYVLSYGSFLNEEGRTERALYLNKVDVSNNTVTARVRITKSDGTGVLNRLHSLVSDGTTLWIIIGRGLRSVDVTTDVASEVRSIPIPESVTLSVRAQTRRLPPAAAYYDGQIYAFYEEPTRGWRFKPSEGSAVRLNAYSFYSSTETLNGVIYGVSGGRLHHIDSER